MKVILTLKTTLAVSAVISILSLTLFTSEVCRANDCSSNDGAGSARYCTFDKNMKWLTDERTPVKQTTKEQRTDTDNIGISAISDISDINNNSTEMVWQNLKKQFKEMHQAEGGEFNSITLPRNFSGLYVFVSSSMPKQLLRSYYIEASNYGGILVFKGLPKGSFKEFTKLVMQLTDNNMESAGSIQIDDEAFERFGVNAVPVIVLAKESEYQPNQNNTPVYDKITGNVGIKFTLEKFANSGDLKKEAMGYLNAPKSK